MILSQQAESRARGCRQVVAYAGAGWGCLRVSPPHDIPHAGYGSPLTQTFRSVDISTCRSVASLDPSSNVWKANCLSDELMSGYLTRITELT